MRKGSLNHWLSTFEVGEVRFKEYDQFGKALPVMKQIQTPTRRPEEMINWRFQATRILAVPIQDALNTYTLLRVVRKA